MVQVVGVHILSNIRSILDGGWIEQDDDKFFTYKSI